MTTQEPNDVYKKPDALFGVRHFQVCLLFLGMVFINLMKVDMSLAIVAMTDSTLNNTFDWSHQRQSVILSSYKWGYLFSKIPGGVLSARFGGKVVLVACGVLNSIFCLILPISGLYGGWQAVCFCRLMQGLAQGVLLPTIHTLTGKWAPLEERSKIGSMLSAGGQFGTAVEYMMAGAVASFWGWQAIFYANGIILVIWTVFYISLGSASPHDSKMISSKERLYIQSSLGQVNKPLRVKMPWKALLTSLPFFTLVVTQVGSGWGYWTLLTEMPTYFNKVLGVNIKENGFFSALPYLGSTVACILFGVISDYILAKRWVGITACRKIFNSIGFFGSAVFLIAVSYVKSDFVVAVTLLTLCVSLFSGGFCGYHLVSLDMAPNHAGTMIGISGLVSNFVSIFAPLAAGFLINDETLPSEWRKVFFLAAGFFIIANIIFLIFGTSERQKWNDVADESLSDEHLDAQTQIEKITLNKKKFKFSIK